MITRIGRIATITRITPILGSGKREVPQIAVSRILFLVFRRGDDHSSSPVITGGIEQPTRRHRTGRPHRLPIWPCSVRGFACHPRYHGRGALLPHLFTLACARCRARQRCVFCATFLRVAPTGRYPAHCPAEFGLSSRLRPSGLQRAIVWRSAATQLSHTVDLPRGRRRVAPCEHP
jgi:hypothetical protein